MTRIWNPTPHSHYSPQHGTTQNRLQCKLIEPSQQQIGWLGLTHAEIQCECLPGQSTQASNNKCLSNIINLFLSCFLIVFVLFVIVRSSLIVFYSTRLNCTLVDSSWFALLVRQQFLAKKHPPPKTPVLYHCTASPAVFFASLLSITST